MIELNYFPSGDASRRYGRGITPGVSFGYA
jgi:hypothetical protein